MESFVQIYQTLPLKINPLAFKVGFLEITWYSLMYLVGLAVVYYLLVWRIKRKESVWNKEKIQDFLGYAFSGLLIGGRLGYVFFYNLPFYLDNPLAVISPFSEGEWVGIYGMSYHGGLIGVILATLFFSRKNKISFIPLADFIIPAVPAGYFFGRLGNFFNGELYGRITEKAWGMYYPGEMMLRHPSQLYEAFFEGLVLFSILWFWRNRPQLKGKFLGLYLLGYSGFRLGIEFFREPDAQIGLFGGFLTLGQIFSVVLITLAILALLFSDKILYNKGNKKV